MFFILIRVNLAGLWDVIYNSGLPDVYLLNWEVNF